MGNEVRLIDAFTIAEEIESLTITVAGEPARWNDAKHSVLRVIAEQKDIDPESLRPKGRWENYPSHLYRRCSVCKVEWEKQRFNIRANYCPNCGAKMEG